ncbi:MAG: hypothetical protein K8L99_11900 [Anaerolineae bacterium]|nr:hypothetical protein [Anaerolineae bacterium]
MFTLREMQPEDSPAYNKLTYETPDSGAVQYRQIYHIDAFHAYQTRHSNVRAVVAEHPAHEGLVGVGAFTFEEILIDGVAQPAAYLSSLAVHPVVRQQGLAQQIAQWRIDKAYEVLGPEAVIFAFIQSGNTGSERNALKWADGLYGKFVIPPLKMRTTPPTPITSVNIRPADTADFEEIARHCNTYFADYNLHHPLHAEGIRTFVAATPIERPVKQWWVAEDAQNHLLAGLQIMELSAMMQMELTQMPAVLRLANRILQIIPADGVMRELQIDNFWFAEGHEAAAAYLWEVMCYEWRDRATFPRLTLDAHNPTLKLIKLPFWVPKPSGAVAVKSPFGFDATRKLNAIL